MLAGLAIAVLVSVIVIERSTLVKSLHVLGHLNWAWFLLAVASEAISLASFGLSRKLLMQVNGRPASLRSVLAITYAATGRWPARSRPPASRCRGTACCWSTGPGPRSAAPESLPAGSPWWSWP